ncbi:protein-disulfide reductase DsbD family protein [Croceicoccus sp. F390]|uniref:Protein-disulfide reductase DsbD family protein n=1 Tax=Croceicoccus esteveae TaxID=3075597 RepID=A0ABU2ZHV2_9SPHN|nr:protein-disulfide reductase DsbD domain-containing protein [Croceicoccus sp. F390]MDT0576191.1 protein-disulfide reductase DsbD family protein [Croceicoccus sp. F390]
MAATSLGEQRIGMDETGLLNQLRRFLVALLLACGLFGAVSPAWANNIAARLVAEQPVRPGEAVTVAIAMEPKPGWHGYWSNPGDAGLGMTLDWDLPAGVSAGEPAYGVPQTLLISGLMNHVYEGPHAILVPLQFAAGVPPGEARIAVVARWLACTDTICVPEQATLAITLPVAVHSNAEPDPRFEKWRAALPAQLAETGTYAITGKRLRVAIPLAAQASVSAPHLFIEQDGLIAYAARQEFSRAGDWLIMETDIAANASFDGTADAVLRFTDNNGIAMTLRPGMVPAAGVPLAAALPANGTLPGTALLLLAAFAGGVLLNIMPCVFPVLSLKALTLARAGGEGARTEALAYTAGIMATVLALGALLLALRAAGQEIGWAFQLQEPATVLLLLLLVVAITANLAGWFELLLPVAIERRGTGAFGTGVLAALVATPCTGPFMAGAMGAALLLPVTAALGLFAALGLGLAFPFLLIGFVPRVRRLLPRPGNWMNSFRKAMAMPMGLTALALLWLCWRLGGLPLFLLAGTGAVLLLSSLWAIGRRQRGGRRVRGAALALMTGALLTGGAAMAMNPRDIATAAMPGTRVFSEAELTRARASNQPVFVYFTADWCVTCKLNEQVAIDRAAVHDAFAGAGVIVLRADWTRRDPAVTRFLGANGAAGVPLYLWYEPNQPVRQLPQILTATMLVDLASR